MKSLFFIKMHGFFYSNLIQIQFFIKMYIKGNTQLIFLCNPQKSGASQACTTFPQTTQKNTN